MTLLQDLNTMFLLMKTYFSSFLARGKSTDRPPMCPDVQFYYQQL